MFSNWKYYWKFEVQINVSGHTTQYKKKKVFIIHLFKTLSTAIVWSRRTLYACRTPQDTRGCVFHRWRYVFNLISSYSTAVCYVSEFAEDDILHQRAEYVVNGKNSKKPISFYLLNFRQTGDFCGKTSAKTYSRVNTPVLALP